MAKRSLRWRGFGVEVEVPERAATALRRVLPGSRGVGQSPQRRSSDAVVEFPAIQPNVHVDPRTDAISSYLKGLEESSPWYRDAWEDVPPEQLAALVQKQIWYHTIELPGGVVTPGYYDHRTLVPHYGLPADLTGQRVLDVGAWDGFWSFEFERRGATVTAVDIDRLVETDFPPAIREAVVAKNLDMRLGGGFEIARRALGSKVQRIARNVYDLDPADLGTHDIVHFADVSLHLERPLEAFRRIRAVTGGRAIIVDSYEPDLDDDERMLTEYQGGYANATWWAPSLRTFAQMVIDAGFSTVRIVNTYRLHPRQELGPGRWRAILDARP